MSAALLFCGENGEYYSRLIWEFSVGGNVWTGQTHSEPRYSISAPVPAVGRQGSSAAVPSSSSSVLSLPSSPAIRLQNYRLRILKRFTSCSIRPISDQSSCGPSRIAKDLEQLDGDCHYQIRVRCLGEARYQIAEVSPPLYKRLSKRANYGYERKIRKVKP